MVTPLGGGPAIADQEEGRSRRYVGLVVAVAILSACVVVIPRVIPSWYRPGWLLPVAIILALCYGLSVAHLAIIGRRRAALIALRGTVMAKPRSGLVLSAALCTIAAAVGFIIAMQTVTPAALVGSDPVHATVITVGACGCGGIEYITTTGVIGARLAPSDATARVGTPVVYNRDHPSWVMTASDWASGRNEALIAAIICLLIGATICTVAVWMARRRRRALSTLRPQYSVLLASRQTPSRSRSQRSRFWRVQFSDGKRVDYVDNQTVRELLRLRLSASGSWANLTRSDQIALDPAANADPWQTVPWSPPPPPPVRPYSRGKQSAAGIYALGLIPAIVLGATVAIMSMRSNSFTKAGPSCTTAAVAPVSASPAAILYLNAVNDTEPDYISISNTIAAAHGVSHRNDLIATINANQKFAAELARISFPTNAQADANALIVSLQQQDAFYTTAVNELGYLAENTQPDDALSHTESAAASQLRRDLNLPRSTCKLYYP